MLKDNSNGKRVSINYRVGGLLFPVTLGNYRIIIIYFQLIFQPVTRQRYRKFK